MGRRRRSSFNDDIKENEGAIPLSRTAGAHYLYSPLVEPSSCHNNNNNGNNPRWKEDRTASSSSSGPATTTTSLELLSRPLLLDDDSVVDDEEAANSVGRNAGSKGGNEFKRRAPSTQLIRLASSAKNNGEGIEEKEEEEDASPSSDLGGYFTILLPLWLVYVSNQWSRYSLSYLVDFSNEATAYKAMNVDIGFTQGQYGTLASVAFTILFALASLFAGNLSDKSNRKLLTIGSCSVWSLSTLSTAVSHTYVQVVLSRIAMGFSCAFTTPCGYTLLRDFFPSSQRAFVNSLYGSGVYLGGALSSLSILLDNQFGWRGALEAIFLYGIVVATLTFFILPNGEREVEGVLPSVANLLQQEETREDNSNQVDKNTNGDNNVLQDALSVLSITRIQLLFVASLLRFGSGLSIAVWGAPYFKMMFQDQAQEYAVVNALIVSVCGLTSGIVGGALADRIAAASTTMTNTKKKNEDSGNDENQSKSSMVEQNDESNDDAKKLFVVVGGSLLAVPAWYFCVHFSTFETAMIWLGLEYLVAECWFGPTVAVLQSSVSNSKGGTAQGLFTSVGALANVVPTILGTWYGSVSQEATSSGTAPSSDEASQLLSNGLATVVCGGYFLSSIFFYLAATTKTSTATNEAQQAS